MTRSDSADGRQVFFWLAAAILAGLVFSLGVMVGRQLEARPAESDDPLDTIDRQAQQARSIDAGQLVFPEVLSQPSPDRAASGMTPREAPAAESKPQTALAATPSRLAAADRQPSPATEDQAPSANANRGNRYCLQVASYRERAQADRLIEQLKSAGYEALRVVSSEVSGKGTYYRVRMGSFVERSQAERVVRELAAKMNVRAMVIAEEE